MKRRLSSTAAALFLLALAALPAAAGPVDVAVTNVRRAQGTVRVALCPQAMFLRDDCPYKGTAPAVAGQTLVVVAEVPPGVYAAQVFLDENDNHDVDRGFLGIPQEGVGFSRDPSYLFSPPDFDDAAVTIGERGGRITVRLRYFD